MVKYEFMERLRIEELNQEFKKKHKIKKDFILVECTVDVTKANLKDVPKFKHFQRGMKDFLKAQYIFSRFIHGLMKFFEDDKHSYYCYVMGWLDGDPKNECMSDSWRGGNSVSLSDEVDIKGMKIKISQSNSRYPPASIIKHVKSRRFKQQLKDRKKERKARRKFQWKKSKKKRNLLEKI